MHIGKPEPEESNEYFRTYIDLVDSEDLVRVLEQQHQKTQLQLASVTDQQGNFRYAEGKWSIKEVVGHLIDTERVFCNRALRFARNDGTVLPGYDHDSYVMESQADYRTIHDLSEEFKAVRKATMLLFKSFDDEMVMRGGMANGAMISVRALGFVIVGHEMHHTKVIRERYLTGLPTDDF